MAPKPENPRISRQEATLLRLIHNQPGVVRSQLCRRLDVSQASLTQILRRLFSNGVLQEAGKAESLGGRRASTLALSPTFLAVQIEDNLLIGADLSLLDPIAQAPAEILEPENLSIAEAMAATRVTTQSPEIFVSISSKVSAAVRKNDSTLPLKGLKKQYPEATHFNKNKFDSEFAQMFIENNIPLDFENAKTFENKKLLSRIDKNSNLIGTITSNLVNLFDAMSANVFVDKESVLYDENRIKNVIHMNASNSLRSSFVLTVQSLQKSDVIQGIAHFSIDKHLKSIENLSSSN